MDCSSLARSRSRGFVSISKTLTKRWSQDTSSVVGAAARYGPQALAIGTTVKLTRALWIVPVSLITATYMRGAAKREGRPGQQAKVKIHGSFSCCLEPL
jgi:ABC-type phosphate transport system permease subunit